MVLSRHLVTRESPPAVGMRIRKSFRFRQMIIIPMYLV